MPSIIAAVFVAASDAAIAQSAQTAAIAAEGAGPLSLGALVGAFVAGGYALRERFKRD